MDKLSIDIIKVALAGMDSSDKEIAKLREELDTLLAKARERGRKEAIPDGWQVVPIEPTEAMFYAGKDAYSFFDVWSAMLASAPKPPEVKP